MVSEDEVLERIALIFQGARDVRAGLPGIIASAEAEINKYARLRGILNLKFRKRLLRTLERLSRFDEPRGKRYGDFESEVSGLLDNLPPELLGVYGEVYQQICHALFQEGVEKRRICELGEQDKGGGPEDYVPVLSTSSFPSGVREELFIGISEYFSKSLI